MRRVPDNTEYVNTERYLGLLPLYNEPASRITRPKGESKKPRRPAAHSRGAGQAEGTLGGIQHPPQEMAPFRPTRRVGRPLAKESEP